MPHYKQAHESLATIERTQAAILQRSAKEYAAWMSWGLYVVIIFPPFDFIEPAIWGPICWISALIGWIITYRYYQKRHVAIKTLQSTPWYAWLTNGLWIAIGIAAANGLQPHLHYAWAISGVVVGLPFVLYGLWLKRKKLA